MSDSTRKPCSKRAAGDVPAGPSWKRIRFARQEDLVYVEGAMCGVPFAVKVSPLFGTVEWNEARSQQIETEMNDGTVSSNQHPQR